MRRVYMVRFLGLVLLLAMLAVGGCATTQQTTGPGGQQQMQRYDDGRPAWYRISPPGT